MFFPSLIHIKKSLMASDACFNVIVCVQHLGFYLHTKRIMTYIKLNIILMVNRLMQFLTTWKFLNPLCNFMPTRSPGYLGLSPVLPVHEPYRLSMSRSYLQLCLLSPFIYDVQVNLGKASNPIVLWHNMDLFEEISTWTKL